MKTGPGCLDCFVRQAAEGMRLIGAAAAAQELVVRQVQALLPTLDREAPPPLMGRAIHRLMADATGNPDPYGEIKERSNRFARELYPELSARVAAAADPFETAVRLAIAGNIIDFSAGLAVSPDLVRQTIALALTQELDRQATGQLRREAAAAGRILYIGDNAGEAVFDCLLLEQLPQKKILYAVRGGPVMNDCTRADAAAAGFEGVVPLIDTGSDIPGIILEHCSARFRAAYARADLIVAKGQGNYETLSDARENIFFLFKVKCATVAASCGKSIGDIALLHALTARGK